MPMWVLSVIGFDGMALAHLAATPDVLDVLDRSQVRATFFLVDRHLTDETA